MAENYMNFFDSSTKSNGELGIGNFGSYGGKNTFDSMYDEGTGGFSLGEGYFDNMDFGGMAKGFGSVAQGVGGLAQAWTGMQGLKLAKKQLETENAQWEKNYEAQRGDIAYDRANRAAARSRQSEASAIG